MQLYLRKPYQPRIFLGQLYESRHRFPSGQNNGPRRLRTHNQRKNRDLASGPDSTPCPVSLPIISEIPRGGFNSDDSDDDAASKAPSAHDNSAFDLSRTTTLPSTTSTTTPPGTSTPLVLTPNPTIRILQPTETSRPPSDTTYRPWTDNDDQELITLKNDTKSRPSWKTIGARLRRDPQVCKMRWAILKQMPDQHGHNQPPREPEAEDRRLMITEVDNQGTERNRQPDFFFNGMIGHVRPRGGGYVDSWAEATRLSNYWRRFYNIDPVYEDQSTWYSQEDQPVWHPQDHQSLGSPDNAALGGEDAEISDLADDTSVTVETGHLAVPSQINQLATVLYNVLIADREFNAPILEKIETAPADPNANPIQVWSASDLSHLSSHLAITANTLAQHVQAGNLGTSPTFRTRSWPFSPLASDSLMYSTLGNSFCLWHFDTLSVTSRPYQSFVSQDRCVFQKSPAAAGRVCVCEPSEEM